MTAMMNEIEHYNMEEAANYGAEFDKVLAIAKEYDSGRWDYEKITIGLTGKDADLTPWGDQGIEIERFDDEFLYFVVHGYKCVAGNDVCLNEPEGFDEDMWDRALEIYLEQAQEVVCGTFYGDMDTGGEWTGDDWSMTFEKSGKIAWVLDDKDAPDYGATIKTMIEKANEMIKRWEDEMVLMDTMLNKLAGWRDGEDERCDEGKPDMEVSIFNPLFWEQEA